MNSRGFTLIELMIGLAIVAIALVLGIPSLNQFLDSSRLKAAATSFSSGLQYARSQAVARNTTIRFRSEVNGGVLTAGWRVATDPPDGEEEEVLQRRSRNEGAANRVNVAASAGFAGIRFNGLGAATPIDAASPTPGTVNANPAIFSFTSPDNACAAAGGPIRCLDVRVTPGGQVRLCDPAAAAGDTRAC